MVKAVIFAALSIGSLVRLAVVVVNAAIEAADDDRHVPN